MLRTSNFRIGSEEWLVSWHRSLLTDADLTEVPWQRARGQLQLWWGPRIEVRQGQLVRHFYTPDGLLHIESVAGAEAAEPGSAAGPPGLPEPPPCCAGRGQKPYRTRGGRIGVQCEGCGRRQVLGTQGWSDPTHAAQ